MFAARGTMMVSRLRYRGRRSIRSRIDVAPSKRVGIKHPHPSHLLYNLPILSFAPKEVHPLPNSNGRMTRSRPRHFTVLSLSQTRHALIIHLSIMIALLLQRQRNNMNLITGQFSTLVISAKDVSTASEDGEGVA